MRTGWARALVVGVVAVLVVTSSGALAQEDEPAETGDEPTAQGEPQAGAGDSPARPSPASFEQLFGYGAAGYFLGAGIGALAGFGAGMAFGSLGCGGAEPVACGFFGLVLGMMIAIPLGAWIGATLGVWIHGEDTDAGGDFLVTLLSGLAALAIPTGLGLAIGAAQGRLAMGSIVGIGIGTALVVLAVPLGYQATRPAGTPAVSVGPGTLTVAF